MDDYLNGLKKQLENKKAELKGKVIENPAGDFSKLYSEIGQLEMQIHNLEIFANPKKADEYKSVEAFADPKKTIDFQKKKENKNFLKIQESFMNQMKKIFRD